MFRKFSVADVAPGRFVSDLCHWKERGAVPLAVTVRFVLAPRNAITSVGPLAIAGSCTKRSRISVPAALVCTTNEVPSVGFRLNAKLAGSKPVMPAVVLAIVQV